MNNLSKLINNEFNNNFIVDGEKLCSQLGIRDDFTSWLLANRKSVTGKLIKYRCVENVDFMRRWTSQKDRFTQEEIKEMSSHKRSAYGIKNKIMLTLNCTIMICEKETKRPKSFDILKFLYLLKDDNSKFIVREQPRYEYQFAEMLEKITGLEWEKQYPINGGKYRLDFYLPSTLIVEYDEEQHENQREKDLERILYCREWLNSNGELENYNDTWRIPVIRVKKGQELEGIHRIIRHLAYCEFKFVDGYYYNIKENCDISC